MTKNMILIEENESIKNASKKMAEYDIGFLPVVKDKKIVGVITDRDIAKIIKDINSFDVPVSDYMTKHLITCDVTSKEDDVLELMKKEKVKRILIKKEKKLVGILSLSDLIFHMDDHTKIMEALKEIFTINRNTDYYPTEIDEFYL